MVLLDFGGWTDGRGWGLEGFERVREGRVRIWVLGLFVIEG